MFRIKSNVKVMDSQPGGQQEGDCLHSTSGRQNNSPLQQNLRYLKRYEELEHNMTSSNFSFKTICKVQWLNGVYEPCTASGSNQARGNVFL